MTAIGIDLGTTNSAAAVGGRDTKVLPNRDNEPLTPSVVGYLVRRRKGGEGEIVVGRAAVNNAERSPEETISSIKRLMGRIHGEPWTLHGETMTVDKVRARVPYALAPPPAADADDQGVKVVLAGKPYSPVEISAMILRKIKEDATFALGEEVTHAVITVPAYFTERQRVATAEAGRLAGLEVLKIIDEPTAAAIAFGAGREAEQHRVLVYDLGGGTFDISVIQMAGGQFQILEILGDNWLGGDDFDQTIVRRIVEFIREMEGYDPSGDRAFLAQAKAEAERIKKALSSQTSYPVFWPAKIPDRGTIDVDLTITRAEFEQDIAPMVDRTIELVNQALRNQHLTPEDITEVLLVGGSTAVPAVQQAVTRLFGPGKVKRHLNPMECVALGAGILASKLPLTPAAAPAPGGDAGRTVVEVTAMHLGIAAGKGNDPDNFAVIIPKGTPYPLSVPRKHTFYPTSDHQTLIRIPIYEGLNARASLNEQQGLIELPLGEGLTADSAVEVSFNYDRNRVLRVGVRVPGTTVDHEETVRRDRPRVAPPAGPPLKDDWREDLQPAIRTAQHFLEVYGPYMDREDRAELEENLARGEGALNEADQASGSRATLVLRNKIFGSGLASQLFLAESAMRDTTNEQALEISEAVAQLREAHQRGRKDLVAELGNSLRITVAKVRNSRPDVKNVEDKVDLAGLLRIRELPG
ncbi:MAG: Hsp70 family protein [Isosphaeraceae bacterium]